MWRQKAGNVIAGAMTALFLILAGTMFVSIILCGLFLFNQAAFAAADIAKENALCLGCHEQSGLRANFNGKEIPLFVDKQTYENSVHGQLACTSCHQGVAEFPHEIKYDKEYKKQMAESCNKCHPQASKDFQASIHGQLGGMVSCNNCHGSHDILKKEDPNSSHYRFNVTDSCNQCHQGLVIESYESSFHGIALKYGYDKAPTCTDCHNSHDILPSSNPASAVSAVNIGTTCEPCHKGMSNAGENLLNGKQHTMPQDKETGFPLWITWKIFLALILFDVVMNGTIPTFELFRHLKNLAARRQKTRLQSDQKFDV